MKIFAFYLPQYHEFEENNKWWGKGFTEWTNVKSAYPLFKNHYQPRVPLNKEYYDLVKDKNVLYKQIQMAKKYGIDGFCFYHYWFSNGKKLMEKPIERFLNEKELNIPFCLCWANENWTRRWDGNDSEVLIAQDYDDESGWYSHYKYLKLFFEDNRYIKDGHGRPIFIIYKPDQIPQIKKWLNYLNELAVNDGFAGICFVCQYPQKDKDIKEFFDYLIDFEPIETECQWNFNRLKTILNPSLFFSLLKNKLDRTFRKKTYRVFDYGVISKSSYKRKYKNKVWRGAFPAWDNTARRKENAYIFHNSSPELFQKYLEKQIDNTIKDNISSEESYIFINAWNEWGEGAYLEPDEKYKFAYLDAVKNARKKYNI